MINLMDSEFNIFTLVIMNVSLRHLEEKLILLIPDVTHLLMKKKEKL